MEKNIVSNWNLLNKNDHIFETVQIYKAIENGHLHILKWLHEKGLPLEPLVKT